MPPPEERLRSHGGGVPTLAEAVAEAKRRLAAVPGKPADLLQRQLALVDELGQFELGRFLLRHKGLNGRWTHYAVVERPAARAAGKPAGHPLEGFLLDEAPGMLATQERFRLFQQVLQGEARDGAAFASVPCGLMGDLLTLDWRGARGFELAGFDLDPESLELGARLASERGLADRARWVKADAWALPDEGRFDVLTSNGLNLYVPEDERVVELYRSFARALKPGGLLVASYLTPPPRLGPGSEWDMSAVDPASLARQAEIFGEALGTKWQNYRSSAETAAQLARAGLQVERTLWDRARIFPTVLARKPR